MSTAVSVNYQSCPAFVIFITQNIGQPFRILTSSAFIVVIKFNPVYLRKERSSLSSTFRINVRLFKSIEVYRNHLMPESICRLFQSFLHLISFLLIMQHDQILDCRFQADLSITSFAWSVMPLLFSIAGEMYNSSTFEIILLIYSLSGSIGLSNSSLLTLESRKKPQKNHSSFRSSN